MAKKKRVTVVGAGRVGQTLGRLAQQAGYEIGEVVCRSPRAAAQAVRFIGAGTPQAVARARLSWADVVLIATPDDEIAQAVQTVRAFGAGLRGAIALHTSGALSSEALRPLSERGFAVGSCHPLQTFPSPALAVGLVPGSYFCLEGEPRAVRAARKLVRALGARSFAIPTNKKTLYHAAAVMASGGVVALASVSLDLLGECGLSQGESSAALLPLIEGTVASIRAVGPARALTGPVRRGDAGTINRNMEAIGTIDPGLLELYRMLAERSLALAEAAGADKQKLAEVRLQITKKG